MSFMDPFFRKIVSINQVRELHNNSKTRTERELLLSRWNELVLPGLESAIANKDAKAFFTMAARGEIPLSGDAYVMEGKALKIFIPLILTTKQAKQFYYMFGCPKFSNVALALMRRWEELFEIDLEQANSIDAIRVASENVPKTKLKELVLKWSAVCTTMDEIKEVKEFIGTWRDESTYLEPLIKEKMNSLLFIYLPQTNDIETIESYYHLSDPQSIVRLLIFEKWIGLCTTFEAVDRAYQVAPDNQKCVMSAFYKVKEFMPI